MAHPSVNHLPFPFELRLEPERERLRIVPRGELDLSTADHLEAALHEQFANGFFHVVADLRELTFLDSTGVRVLWQAHEGAERDGVRLSLIPGSGEVGRALELTGLLTRMDLLER